MQQPKSLQKFGMQLVSKNSTDSLQNNALNQHNDSLQNEWPQHRAQPSQEFKLHFEIDMMIVTTGLICLNRRFIVIALKARPQKLNTTTFHMFGPATPAQPSQCDLWMDFWWRLQPNLSWTSQLAWNEIFGRACPVNLCCPQTWPQFLRAPDTSKFSAWWQTVHSILHGEMVLSNVPKSWRRRDPASWKWREGS